MCVTARHSFNNSVTVDVCDIFGGLNVASLLVLTISNLLSATRLNLG